MRKTSRRRLVALIALVSLAGVVRPSPRARAQEAAQSTVTVTIDGSKDPDKIPDWILWREIFRVCALLSDNAKDHGDEIWLKHLAMRKNEEVKFVARAFVWQVDDADYDKLAKGLAGDGQNLSDNVKERLRDLFERKKAMILDHRAKLKDELKRLSLL